MYYVYGIYVCPASLPAAGTQPVLMMQLHKAVRRSFQHTQAPTSSTAELEVQGTHTAAEPAYAVAHTHKYCRNAPLLVALQLLGSQDSGVID